MRVCVCMVMVETRCLCVRTCVCACFISAEIVLQDETGTAKHEEFVTSDVRV